MFDDHQSAGTLAVLDEWDRNDDEIAYELTRAAEAEFHEEAQAAVADGGDPPLRSIPYELDTMPPGPVLAACLAGIDVDTLDGHDRVVVMRAHARMAAHFQAHVYADMASVTEFMCGIYDDMTTGAESAAAEIAMALNLTRRASDNELAMALDLRERLPQVWRLFANGDIDMRRARTIAHATSHLSMAQAREAADRILPEAPHLTTGQIATRLRKLCLEADPEDAAKRYDDAVEDRRVSVEQNPWGTGNLYALDLPADRLAAIRRRIHDLALSLKTANETRTMDQIRTDVFLDLLEGTQHLTDGACEGIVDIQVDLGTLVGLSEAPGELRGFGPVVADVARHVVAGAGGAEWRWSVTGENGDVIANGITGRRPTAAMRRWVEARRRVCVFPGCRMPATRSDLDHTTPYAQARHTHVGSLAPLCRHHHTVRHLPGWSYRIDESGAIVWRTPLRHTYTRRGPP